MARKPPPSGGGGWEAADAGAILALQPCLGQAGAQGKIPKNVRRLESQSWAGRRYIGTNIKP